MLDQSLHSLGVLHDDADQAETADSNRCEHDQRRDFVGVTDLHPHTTRTRGCCARAAEHPDSTLRLARFYARAATPDALRQRNR